MASSFWNRVKRLYQRTVRKPKHRPVYKPKHPVTYRRPPSRVPVSKPPQVHTEGPLNLSTTVDMIHKAGRERKVLEITYDSNTRLVEPYSFRETATSRLFFGYCSIHAKIHSFKPEKIQKIRITDMLFSPRWTVEL